MNWLSLPWPELALAVPLFGAAVVALVRDRHAAWRVCVGFAALALGCSLVPWVGLANGAAPARDPLADLAGHAVFEVDRLSAPLLPLVALLHLLTVVATARTKVERFPFAGFLVGASVRLAAFACTDPWPLIGILALGAVPPYLELRQRGRSGRVFALHMGLFVGLMVVGQAGVEAGAAGAAAALLAAALIRCGTVPFHLWVPDLFANTSFGTALLFVAPGTGVYAAVRLVLPVAPDWALTTIGVLSLVTGLYAAGMAVVQTDARRFFAFLFLSHGALVLVGLEQHTAISLTGALCLWASVALSLGGLGLTLRAIEARYGRLSLAGYRGLYEQSPSLAVCFLLTGLGSVGFPGTLGFVAAEVLVDGCLGANLAVGVVAVAVGATNGIAVVRAYLLLFTGGRHESRAALGITARERFAVLSLAALILGGGLYPQPGVSDRHLVAEGIVAQRELRYPEEHIWNLGGDEAAPHGHPEPGHTDPGHTEPGHAD